MMDMRHRQVWLWGALLSLLAGLAASAEWLGDYAEDYATLNYCFTTRATTGVPATLAGTPVIAVYKGSATDTEKTSAEAYITLSVDFDSITGLNNLLIDLSGDAFFATGEDYSIVIATGTVNSVSVVGETIATFSIENRYERGTDSANMTVPDAAGTAATLVGDLETHGDSAWATAAGFSTHAAADVWSAGSRSLSTPADYKATGFSTHSAADVWTAGSRELSTPADYKADVSGLSTLDAAGVRSAVGLASANLDTQIAAIPTTEPDASGTAATLIDDLETHGDSAWATADVSGLATSEELATHDGKLDIAQADLDTLTGSDGATLATAQGNYAPAKKGDAMTLAADAINAEALADSALAEFATVDTGEAAAVEGSVADLSKGTSASGDGPITFTYTVTNADTGASVAGVRVQVYVEEAMTTRVADQTTDVFGVVTFYLDAGTYYLKRTKSGWTFTNPDTEVVA